MHTTMRGAFFGPRRNSFSVSRRTTLCYSLLRISGLCPLINFHPREATLVLAESHAQTFSLAFLSAIPDSQRVLYTKRPVLIKGQGFFPKSHIAYLNDIQMLLAKMSLSGNALASRDHLMMVFPSFRSYWFFRHARVQKPHCRAMQGALHYRGIFKSNWMWTALAPTRGQNHC